MKPKAAKQKKPKLLYQLVDQDGNCVVINANYWKADLKRTKSARSYHSQGTVVNQIKRAVEYIKGIKLTTIPGDYSYQGIKLYGEVVSKEDLIMAILALKIQTFEMVPTTSIDLIFHLDKLA